MVQYIYLQQLASFKGMNCVINRSEVQIAKLNTDTLTDPMKHNSYYNVACPFFALVCVCVTHIFV